MLGLVEDVGFGKDLQGDLSETEAGRKPADGNNRCMAFFLRLDRLFAELGPEGKLVFVKDVPQAFRHPQCAAEQDDLRPRLEGLPDCFHHLADASVEPSCRLSDEEEFRPV